MMQIETYTMLSILIPTYDYTCYKLVFDLHEQAERLGIDYEIILAEDGSRSPVNVIANHKILELSNCRHVVRKDNTGQAVLRNDLARMAKYNWIVFIDSDAQVDNADYLANYVKYIGKADVVVGGLQTPATNYDPNRTLRYKYESAADKHRSAASRMQNPYMHLTCFNAMLNRSVFLSVLFDKDCHEYGYEDALFGVELKARGISVLHIDNPLTHKGIDTNEEFIRKSETALRTLKSLDGRMQGASHVENAYNKLRSLHLAWAMRLFHRMFGKLVRRNLMSAKPSLTLFSVYKLGYYSCLK